MIDSRHLVEPEHSMDLIVAVIRRARFDARRNAEAREFVVDVARRCMANADGGEISFADVAHAALEVIWERGQEQSKCA